MKPHRPSSYSRLLGLSALFSAFALSGAHPAFAAPADVPGLVLWLDASDEATLSLDADGLVEEWRDKSGNDYHAAQDTAVERPEWEADALGGFAAVRFGFNSVNSVLDQNLRLSGDGLNIARAVNGMTFFAVAQNTPAGAQGIFRASHGFNEAAIDDDEDIIDKEAAKEAAREAAAAGARAFFYRATGDHRVGGQRVDNDDPQAEFLSEPPSFLAINSPSGSAGSDWRVDSAYIDYLSSVAEIFINGEFQADGFIENPPFPGAPTSDTASEAVVIGNRAQGGQTFRGLIAELLVYDRALAPSEIEAVNAHLMDKYGLPIVLNRLRVTLQQSTTLAPDDWEDVPLSQSELSERRIFPRPEGDAVFYRFKVEEVEILD